MTTGLSLGVSTIQELAKDYSSRFETRIRYNGDKYLCVKGGLETEENSRLGDLIRSAHGDMMPDDWRYTFIVESLDAIAKSEEGEEDICLEADIETYKQLQWVSSRNDRLEYCDRANEDWGHPAYLSMFDRLQWGQSEEKNEVLASVLNSLRQILSEQS